MTITIEQTHRIDGDRMFATSTVRLPGAPFEKLFRLIFEESWDWWPHGRTTARTQNEKGSGRFVLRPMWLRSPAQVGIEMDTPETTGQPGSRRAVAKARFFGSFDGPGRYELEEVADGVVLRSVFEGVRRRGFLKLLPVASVLDIHLRAEAGTLQFPFPKGTGFVGLERRLDGGETP